MKFYKMEMWYAFPNKDTGSVNIFFSYDGSQLESFSKKMECEFENCYENKKNMDFLLLIVETTNEITENCIPFSGPFGNGLIGYNDI